MCNTEEWRRGLKPRPSLIDLLVKSSKLQLLQYHSLFLAVLSPLKFVTIRENSSRLGKVWEKVVESGRLDMNTQ